MIPASIRQKAPGPVRALSTALLALGIGSSDAMTEKDAVIRCLRSDKEISLLGLDASVDSLDLAIARAAWLPKLKALAGAALADRDSAFGGGFAGKGAEFGTGLAIDQALPGGGAVHGSVAAVSREQGQGINTRDGRYDLTLSQPLLKGAWRNGDTDFMVRIRSLEHEASALENRKRILASISRIRFLYWNHIATGRLLSFSREAENYTRARLDSGRKRFLKGDIPELDTLSDHVDLLKMKLKSLKLARQSSHARLELALELGIPLDSVQESREAEFTIGDLPEVDTVLQRARRFDPQSKIFEKMGKSLSMQFDRDKNALLPSLDLGMDVSGGYRDGDPLRGPQFLPNHTVFSLLLSYSIPAREERLKARRTALEMRRNGVRGSAYQDSLRSKVSDLVEALRQERESLGLAEEAERVSKRQLAIAAKGFDSGVIDRLSVTKAEADGYSLSMETISTGIALKWAEICLDEITGDALWKFGLSWE